MNIDYIAYYRFFFLNAKHPRTCSMNTAKMKIGPTSPISQEQGQQKQGQGQENQGQPDLVS